MRNVQILNQVLKESKKKYTELCIFSQNEGHTFLMS